MDWVLALFNNFHTLYVIYREVSALTLISF
jgi:hypothetical protein